MTSGSSVNTYRWHGIITAVSSIVHGGESLGTVRYLRREKFLLPDGTVEEIPVLSGNMIRGIMRRVSADLWWEQAGKPQFTLPVAHAIWAGGALARSTGSPVTGQKALQLRNTCPVIGLYGAAGGGRILEGAVQIGKGIPICTETSHVTPDNIKIMEPETPVPSIWDLTQIEYHTKTVTSAKSNRTLETETGTDIQQMRFGTETFLPGSKFHTWWNITWASETELSLWLETIMVLQNSGIPIGGGTSRGHGKVNWKMIGPQLTFNVTPTQWRDEIPQDSLEFRKTMAWLD